MDHKEDNMAIDSVEKRLSMMHFQSDGVNTMVYPTGIVDSAGRIDFLDLFRGQTVTPLVTFKYPIEGVIDDQDEIVGVIYDQDEIEGIIDNQGDIEGVIDG